MDEQIVTQEGYDKLKKELDYLLNIKRKDIAERIQRSKDMGDLSENAEYAEAKDAQAFNDGRIAELMTMLKNLTVVQNGKTNEYVGMGSKVTARTNGGIKEYTIVSFNEADPLSGKISNESPLGRALIHKKTNDRVTVETPRGVMEYEIVKIE